MPPSPLDPFDLSGPPSTVGDLDYAGDALGPERAAEVFRGIAEGAVGPRARAGLLTEAAHYWGLRPRRRSHLRDPAVRAALMREAERLGDGGSAAPPHPALTNPLVSASVARLLGAGALDWALVHPHLGGARRGQSGRWEFPTLEPEVRAAREAERIRRAAARRLDLTWREALAGHAARAIVSEGPGADQDHWERVGDILGSRALPTPRGLAAPAPEAGLWSDAWCGPGAWGAARAAAARRVAAALLAQEHDWDPGAAEMVTAVVGGAARGGYLEASDVRDALPTPWDCAVVCLFVDRPGLSGAAWYPASDSPHRWLVWVGGGAETSPFPRLLTPMALLDLNAGERPLRIWYDPAGGRFRRSATLAQVRARAGW